MSKKEAKSSLDEKGHPSLTSAASKLHITRRSHSCLAVADSSSFILEKLDDQRDSYVSNLDKGSQGSGGDTSSTDSSIRESEYIRIRSTMQRVDEFFDRIGDMPSINDIALSSEEDLKLQTVSMATVVKSVTSGPDVGRFVDPITGQPISSTSSSSVMDIPPTENIEEHEKEEETSDLDISDESLLEQVEVEEEEIEKFPEDDLAMWIDLQPKKIFQIEEDIDFEELRRKEEYEQISEITTLFLEELIFRIVENCEYIDPNVLLRQNLNKNKLMNKLSDLLNQLHSEQKSHQFLNKKVIEYFHRKKMARPLEVEGPDTIMQSLEYYKAAINKLDQIIDHENGLKTLAEKKKANVLSDVETSEVQFRQKKKQLEDLIKKNLCKENFSHLTAVSDIEFRFVSSTFLAFSYLFF